MFLDTLVAIFILILKKKEDEFIVINVYVSRNN
jgi:hypothetical protein